MGQCLNTPRSEPETRRYFPLPALPPGQQPHPNPDFLRDALLTSDSLTFLPESSETSVSFKSFGKITILGQLGIRSTCIVPERNLLLLVPSNCNTMYIYNIANDFQLISMKTSETEIGSVSYSRELNKILVGAFSLQIWDPTTLNIEMQSPQSKEQIFVIEYFPNPDIFVAKTDETIETYDRNLTMLTRFELPPNGCRISPSAEIFPISQDLILAIWSSRSLLLNLKKESIFEFDQLYMPFDSCVQMTQETPSKVFTCLTSLRRHAGVPFGQLIPHKLTQFSIDSETEELVISRVTKTNHDFHSLYRLKDRKYFLAQGYNPSNTPEFFFLTIEKDQVEIVRVVSGLANSLGRYNAFLMINSVIIHNKDGVLYLYRSENKQKKENRAQELDVDSEKSNPA